MFIPIKAQPPVKSTAGGASGPAQDILEAWSVVEKDRGVSYKVAERVPNPNRYFDAFKALGGAVTVRRNGTVNTAKGERNAFDIYVVVAPGELKPHRKPSQLQPAAAPAVAVKS